MKKLIILGAALALSTGTALADFVHVVDIAGIESRDNQWDPDNVVLAVDVASAVGLPAGTPIDLNGVGWDVSLQTESGSTLAEASIYFDENVSPGSSGLTLTPGAGDGWPGMGDYSSGGIVDVSDIALPDGVLRIEFYETNDQYPDFADAVWTAGTLTVRVTPEPSALLMLGVGMLVLRRR